MAITKVTLALYFLGMLAVGQGAAIPWKGEPLPVIGTGATDPDVHLVGNLQAKTFKLVNGVVTLVGQLVGTLTDAAGSAKKVDLEVNVAVIVSTHPADGGHRKMLSLPVPAGCDVLNLAIPGGVNLDLLGLAVVLQPVELDIVAVPGAGNLLGNLLCAVTGLLDHGNLAGLVAQLNLILKQLLGGGLLGGVLG